MGSTVSSVLPADDETYPLRPTGGQILSMLLGGLMMLSGFAFIKEEGSGSFGPIFIGSVIVALAVISWKARKVRLTEKALIVSALGKQRTIPYSKIEAVDFDDRLSGTIIWISGTGTTRTAITPHKRAQELYDKLCVLVSR